MITSPFLYNFLFFWELYGWVALKSATWLLRLDLSPAWAICFLYPLSSSFLSLHLPHGKAHLPVAY